MRFIVILWKSVILLLRSNMRGVIMKKIIILLIILLLTMLCMTSCAKSNANPNMNVVDDNSTNVEMNTTSNEERYTFSAYVHEINDSYMLVTPIKTATEVNTASLISIDLNSISDDSMPMLGDTYEIVYDGLIQETFPAQLNKIYEMKRIANGSKLNDMNIIKLIEEGEYHTLYEIDTKALDAVLMNYEWTDGTSDCLSDYELIIDGVHYVYHIDCGTFNDNTNQKSLKLNEEDKELVDDLLEQFVSTRYWSSGPIKKVSF